MDNTHLAWVLLVSFIVLSASNGVPQTKCSGDIVSCPDVESQSTAEEVAACHHSYEEMVNLMEAVADRLEHPLSLKRHHIDIMCADPTSI